MKLSKAKKITLIAIILLLFTTTACSSQYIKTKSNSDIEETIKVAIIFNEAGLGDKSFNDLCYDGLLMAQDELGIEFDYSQSKSTDDYENLCREYAKVEEYDLIISVGAEQEEAVEKISKEFPNQKFTLMDSKLELPNVSTIYTNWSEQTFLNGVIAGLAISNHKDEYENKEVVGVILGKDLEYLRKGAVGFEAGVRYVNPDVETIVGTVDDFSNPAKAKEIALLMYNKGATYIQQIAGESGLGVFAAAKEADKYAFGVDDNQNFLDPDYIVSTATRYANEIIYEEIKAVINNTWSPGVHKLGLKENVIGYTREGSNVEIDNHIIESVESIKKSIIDKEILIPSTYEELEVWIKLNQYKN
jgi:basic membrane protein A